jgi:Transposase
VDESNEGQSSSAGGEAATLIGWGKRRILEATLVPGASNCAVAREHGVNANQVFQWRYVYRKHGSGKKR